MTVATFPTSEPRTRRWTREEFYKLAEEGWFQGQRVLLLEGEIIQMPPQKSDHAWSVLCCQKAMEKAFGPTHWVRVQMPLNVGRRSDPEPDIAVTPDPPEAYTKQHPSSALIVIEVSDSSIDLDRRKCVTYAAAGFQEYWIVNLRDRKLEVFRAPDRQNSRYGEERHLSLQESIAPLARPDSTISIATWFA